MASDVITALGNALKDLVKEQKQKEEVVKKCQEEVSRAQSVIQGVRERVKCADYERHAIERDLEALRTLYNNASEKPQAVLLRIEQLQADHAPAFEKSQAENKMLQDQEQKLRESHTRFSVAQETLKDVQDRYRQLSELLQKEQNKL